MVVVRASGAAKLRCRKQESYASQMSYGQRTCMAYEDFNRLHRRATAGNLNIGPTSLKYSW